MALVDSESAFKKRCEQLQVGLAEKAEAQNLSTFSTFAFAAGSPQNQVSDAEITKLADTIYGTPTLGDVATIRRLHFESCTYLLNDMKTNAINTDSSSSSSGLLDVDTSTELRLFFALQRRHLAFELVNLLSWQPCQIWLDKLMGSLLHESAHSGPALSLAQILRADREIFNIMASEFSGALIGEKDKPPPLDAVFLRLMHDPRVNVHLIALPRVAPGVNGGHPKGNKREADHGGGNKPQPLKRPRTGDKEPAQVPEELKGLKLRTTEGKPMCWHFNLSKGCSNPTKNGRCKFGFHTCMKCLRPKHGAAACHANGTS